LEVTISKLIFGFIMLLYNTEYP